MKKKFEYYMGPDANTFYVVAGGAVGTTTTPTPVQSDPIEWDAVDIRMSRNAKYHGLVRSMAFPLSLTRDAALIARHVYFTEGVDGKCLFTVKELNSTDQLYKTMFVGMLDFSKASNKALYFQCDVEEGGLGALLKAKSNIPQEIPVTRSSSLYTYFDGIRLVNSSVLELANDLNATATWHQMMPTIKVQSNESPVQVDVIAQPVQVGAGATFIYQNYPFFKATIAGTVSVDFDITISVTNPASSNLSAHAFSIVVWQVNAANNAVVKTEILYRDLNSTSYLANPVRATGSKAFAMLPGEKLVYFSGLSPFNNAAGSDAFLVRQVYQYSTLKVHYDLRLAGSIVLGRRYADVYADLISRMTDGQYAGISSYLSNPNLVTFDARPYFTLISPGDGVRGLGTDAKPAVIKTDLDELFADATAKWMMGLGVERDAAGNEVARLEHRAYFYRKNEVTFTLTEPVTEFEFVDDLEDSGNLYKTGTADQTYDGLNGRSEPNQTFIFSLPTEVTTSEVDQTSPYRADMYGIEILRANLAEKRTTDSSSDNDTFTFEVDPTPVNALFPIGLNPVPQSLMLYQLARPQNKAGGSASGIAAGDTAFNLTDTPKRRLLRNGPALRAFLNHRPGHYIKFKTTEKNADAVSNLGSGQIVERADVQVASLGEPLYLAKLFRFKTRVPKGLREAVEAAPYGVIEFPVILKGKRREFRGFIKTVNAKPGTNAPCVWELRPVPDTDLTQLIY